MCYLGALSSYKNQGNRRIKYGVKIMNSYDQTIDNHGLQEFVDQHKSYLDTIKIKKDTILYHYTNYEGLKGILSDQRLWFTDYKHLNDTSEIKYSKRVRVLARYPKECWYCVAGARVAAGRLFGWLKMNNIRD